MKVAYTFVVGNEIKKRCDFFGGVHFHANGVWRQQTVGPEDAVERFRHELVFESPSVFVLSRELKDSRIIQFHDNRVKRFTYDSIPCQERQKIHE